MVRVFPPEARFPGIQEGGSALQRLLSHVPSLSAASTQPQPVGQRRCFTKHRSPIATHILPSPPIRMAVQHHTPHSIRKKAMQWKMSDCHDTDRGLLELHKRADGLRGHLGKGGPSEAGPGGHPAQQVPRPGQFSRPAAFHDGNPPVHPIGPVSPSPIQRLPAPGSRFSCPSYLQFVS